MWLRAVKPSVAGFDDKRIIFLFTVAQ